MSFALQPSISQHESRSHATSQKQLPERASSHVESQQRSCQECDAKFSRLEHLKRHITSHHCDEQLKPHVCAHCGKGYTRRDVMLRHRQSCRPEENSTTNRTCNKCNERQLKCSGDIICQKCKDLGQTCTYPSGEDSNYQDQAENSVESSRSASETSVKRIRQRSKASSFGTSKITLPQIRPGYERPYNLFDTIEVDSDQLGPGEGGYDRIADQTEASTPDGQRSAEGPNRPRQSSHYQSNIDGNPVSDRQDLLNNGFGRGLSQDGSPKDRRPINKRGRYVSKACKSCQKRKVKCSGEDTCKQCHSAGLECEYSHGRKRRNTFITRDKKSNVTPSVEQLKPTARAGDTKGSAESLMEVMMARIERLESDCNFFRTHQVAMALSDYDIAVLGSSTGHEDDAQSECDSSIMSLPSLHGATSVLPTINVLNQTVASHIDDDELPETPGQKQLPNASPSMDWNYLPRRAYKDLQTLEKETRNMDEDFLRQSFDTYFLRINPHYPSLNENYIRSRLEQFLTNQNTFFPIGGGDRYQFIALVNLIQAEVKILGNSCSGSDDVPGWEEFCRADSILSQLIWLGNGNLWTIQCLLMKGRYLLYLEKPDSGFDTVSQAVRLCFKLGLHDQLSWSNCHPFETIMRQRIFWSIFCLERQLAWICGAPYLIRESDVRVDLPPSLDDKAIFPFETLPEESQEQSSAPYLIGVAKLGKLCSEIWDVHIGINAAKPTSQEFVVSMDARILYYASQLPEVLQWHNNLHRLDGTTNTPHYILQQTIFLHLRINQLRMLLRQESILSLKYSNSVAQDCVSIASSSINAIRTYQASRSYTTTDRFASVHYLVGSLLSLVCIIVKTDNLEHTRAEAIESFRAGLSVIKELSPYFSFARHTLRRLHKIIGSVMQAINAFSNTTPTETDPTESGMQPIMSHINNFFNYTSLDAGDMLTQQLSGPLTYSLEPMVGDSPVLADDMDLFWINDFLKNS